MIRLATSLWLSTLIASLCFPLAAFGQEEEPKKEYVSPFESKTKYKEGDVSPFSGNPPDGRWLIDEFGREFYEASHPKDGYMVKNEDGTLGVPRFNVKYTILREDEENYYIRINRSYVYNTGNMEALIKDEDREAAAKTYEVTGVSTEDRWILEPFDEGLPKSGMWRNGFDVVDMNEDGHLDVVHGPPRKGPTRPFIFLGDSKGNWKEWPITIDEKGLTYGDIAAGDFNNDGHMDLAFGLHLSGLTAYTGDGKGNFEPAGEGIRRILPEKDRREMRLLKQNSANAMASKKPTTRTPQQQPRSKKKNPESRIPLPFTSRAIDLLDWDGDGFLDILAVSEGPRGLLDVDRSGLTGSVVYTYEGDGQWSPILSLEGEFALSADHVYPANLNGDDLVDFVTSSNALGFHKLLNIHQKDHTWKPTPIPSFRSMTWAWAIAVGDLDQDGLDDLVVAYRNRQLRIPRTGIDVFLNRNKGEEWERKTLWAESDESKFIDYQAMELGDFDGDQKLDLVLTSNHGRLDLFRGEGNGDFTRELTPEFEVLEQCRGFQVHTEDLDGDGRDEILASFAGEQCPKLGSIRAFKVKDNN